LSNDRDINDVVVLQIQELHMLGLKNGIVEGINSLVGKNQVQKLH
jgi:hypothetical protein